MASQPQNLVSHEKTFQLIELIQAEACMWDMYDESYHDRNKKRRVVDDIANSLQLPGKFLEIIRPNFCRLSNKFCPPVKLFLLPIYYVLT